MSLTGSQRTVAAGDYLKKIEKEVGRERGRKGFVRVLRGRSVL